MKELINIINEWPVIVQGALGSALFAAIVAIGQFLITKAQGAISKHSKKSRISWLVSAQCKYEAFSTDDNVKATHRVTVLVYRSSRFLFKGLMWLSLGLIFQSFIGISGIIGFIGCLYYLFKAYDVVSPIPEGMDYKKEQFKILSELDELGALKETNKSSNLTGEKDSPPS